MIDSKVVYVSHRAKGLGAIAALAFAFMLIWAIVPQAHAAQTKITTDMVAVIANQTYTGKELQPALTIEDAGTPLVQDTDYRVEYSNNVNVGQATVTITGIGNYTGTLTSEFSITARDIGATDITVDAIEDQTYTGEELKPAITVKDGTTTLTEDSDYTVEYVDNTDVGTATAKITGKGNYMYVRTATFTIVPADLTKAVVTGADQKYTGSALKTTVTVTLNGVTLTEDKDYTVGPYYNNTEVGVATVAIKGIGSCTGDAIGTFYITEPVAMYRVYNPNSGEHFYTASVDERDWLVELGWNNEGTGWFAPSHSASPVYRLYNPAAGEHHYTLDEKERDTLIEAGWNNEGTGWYSDDDKTVEIMREYNPNEYAWNHNYTVNQTEHEELIKLGWKDEGVAWYGLTSASA